ncbi:MAG: CehA/McbA family metallohydrolase [Chloroflexi bacterium]|nr:CehA/McbA family metallohydrolase [Chloroflexota bacterium]
MLPVEARGPVYVTALAPDLGIAGMSNPIEPLPAGGHRIFFGDLHAHAFDRFGGRPARAPFQPNGFGTYAEAYTYARHVAGLDFVALATFHSSDPQHWPGYLGLSRRVQEPGQFVTLPAVEVSDRAAGHRVVVFPDDDPAKVPDVAGGRLPDLWQTLEGTGALAIPHHTNASSEGGPQSWDVQDWSTHDPRFQTVVEITQNRGAFEVDLPDAWDRSGGATVIGGRGASVQDALARGCRLGFVGGTDNHYAQPGSNRCAKGGVDFHDRVTGGLTAILAPALSRESVMAALRARRCYATTGARMLLDCSVDGHLMGEEFTTRAATAHLTARVTGDGELARLEVIRDNAVVHTQQVASRQAALDLTLPLEPGKTTIFYLRVAQADGQVGWTSPVWVSREQSRAREPSRRETRRSNHG